MKRRTEMEQSKARQTDTKLKLKEDKQQKYIKWGRYYVMLYCVYM